VTAPFQLGKVGAQKRQRVFEASVRVLPRSRHLPVAVTEVSLTEKVNKTGVRLLS
jgi:hypothetical protein